MSRIRIRHDPECKIPHTVDLDCDEAELLRTEESHHAKWDCVRSPSRTQPAHNFDFENGGECVYGCGTSWDQLMLGGDADV